MWEVRLKLRIRGKGERRSRRDKDTVGGREEGRERWRERVGVDVSVGYW